MTYFFEDFSLDVDRRELRRGTNLVAVEPQIFDLLLYLIRNRDHVVGKDELIASVWKGRIVSESALTSSLTAVRQAIGDSGKQQRLIRTAARKGFRFVGAVREEQPATPDEATHVPQPHEQTITFGKTGDGFNLAISTMGQGPVLIKTGNWLTHIESPVWFPFFQHLAGSSRVVRYDGRGTGLSDRSVSRISFETFVEDLRTVVETLHLERFALLGIAAGAATAVAYAVLYPNRVSKLILYGGYARGRNKRSNPQSAEEAKTLLALMERGWGNEHSAFMRAFSSIFLPNASAEQIKWFAEIQRVATSAETAAKYRLALDDIDIVHLLPKIAVPTIVFHCLKDQVVPFEQGRLLATLIPDARLVPLESENHVLIPHEVAWTKFLAETEAFLERRT